MTTIATTPTYCTISLHETRKLAKVKASGACWAVYSVLCGYSRVGKFFAFPSQATIRTALDNAYSIRTIQDAIKFLEDHRIIKRKASGTQRKSKTIHLITRKARHLAQMVFDGANSNPRSSASTKTAQSTGGKPQNQKQYTKPPTTEDRAQKRTTKGTRLFKKGNFERFDNAPERRYSCDEERYCEAIQAHLVAPTHWEKPEPYKWPERAISWLQSDVIENPTKYSIGVADFEAVKAFIVSAQDE